VLREFAHFHRYWGMIVRMTSASPPAELRVRLAADPVCVSGARRFVSDGLRSWRRQDLLDDAELCVSELAGNAVLHSGTTFMEIVLQTLHRGVRISVEDDGPTPAAAVVPRQPFAADGDETDLDDEPTTGRGLAIVSILASSWGVELTGAGKRIWAELVAGDTEYGVRPPVGEDELPDHPSPPGMLPEGWGRVQMVGCPVELSLRQDQHLDELVRELQLISIEDNPSSRELAAQLQDLLRGPAAARHTGRRVAQGAAAAGLESIDIEMAMPREFGAEVEKLQEAVRRADRLCAEMQLLTLASTPELQALRGWMTEQVSGQLRDDAEPEPWPVWLARHSG
jgi:anti-sigma regulatory factor (Ser/Thr protein kinase)